MFVRFMCMMTLALLTGSCFPVKETLPPEAENAPMAAPDQTNGLERPLKEPPRSAVLDDDALHEAITTLWPSADRYALRREEDRELLVGFPAVVDRPLGLASLTRVGWATGSVGMVVGVDTAGTRITRVLTLSPKGMQEGFQRYREAKNRFLSQFEGRPVDAVGGIRVIEGARRFCQSLARCIENEARYLAEVAGERERVDAMAEDAWQLPPQETVIARPLSPGEQPEADAQGPAPHTRRPALQDEARDMTNVWLEPPLLAVLMICVTTLLVTLVLATRRG